MKTFMRILFLVFTYNVHVWLNMISVSLSQVKKYLIPNMILIKTIFLR